MSVFSFQPNRRFFNRAMITRSAITRAALLSLAFFLTACDTTPNKPDSDSGANVEEHGSRAGQAGSNGGADGSGASSSGASGPQRFAGNPLDDPNHAMHQALAERIVYFEYDSDRVAPQYRQILNAHAEFLAARGDVKVTVEGHADERGSREYNIGLGERRAQAVRRYLLFQGASSSQITVVSYGEEQPVAFGHNETAWAKNRRVELVYPK